MTALPMHDRFAGNADDFYEYLIQAHDGLTDADSAALNARLLLILANAVGEADLLRQAIDLARLSLRQAVDAEQEPC